MSSHSHSRTGSLSEFIHFLFKAQLVDPTALQIAQLEQDHPELKGETGMLLKTFKESSIPVDDHGDFFDDVDEFEDQFLGSSFSTGVTSDITSDSGMDETFVGGFPMGGFTQRAGAHTVHAHAHAHGSRTGHGHKRRTSSIFDTSRFTSASPLPDQTFVSSPTSPTSTTPSSPTFGSSVHEWRLYSSSSSPSSTSGAQPRTSSESTRTTSTS